MNYTDADLIAKWDDFFSTGDYRLNILAIADGYPDRKSLNIDYSDLDSYDPDMAMHIMDCPDQALSMGKVAMKNRMPPGKEWYEVNIRVRGLPRDSRVEIRSLRSKHLGKLIAVEGLVRKATEVRPRMVKGLFRCARCDAEIWEDQTGMMYREPSMCTNFEGSCNKTATKFILDQENSIFIDTQKIEIQESPEGLRGGAQPERLAGFLEDDIAGQISPGNRLTLNGILRSLQKGGREKSTLFEIHMDVHSMEFAQHEYDEIEITEEDELMIREAAKDPELFNNIVKSVSPTIYGMETEKEAIALQLFGGSAKDMDDGTKIRGDIHILLIGDPGVAKCVSAETQVSLWSGAQARIGDLVDQALDDGDVQEVDDGVFAETSIDILTVGKDGKLCKGKAVRAWKRDAPSKMFELTTLSGKSLTVTPTHPLLGEAGRWKKAADIEVGDRIAVVDDGGLRHEAVISKEERPPADYVYDMEVQDTHNFVSNAVVSHNSQLLHYMSMLAPRGIYASGKSASAAGLCVAPDSMISTNRGETTIGEFVESRLTAPEEVQPGVWRQEVTGDMVLSLCMQAVRSPKVSAIWKIKTPSFLVEIITVQGDRLVLTPETKIMAKKGSCFDWYCARELEPEDQTIMYCPAGPKMFPMRWGIICSIKNLQENLPEYVYDLTVEHDHSFIANGFLVHNTAAAVKDDFGDGRWTLEAGALVLADKGLACIDELDKMSTQDRSSLHEAMESQRISVAKAGITATLQCRCSLLAAANPKHGRFEDFTSIAEQIDLPPALMSRFDLIFVLTDKPEQVRDREITQHILKAHRRGQARRYEISEENADLPLAAILAGTTEIKPIYDIDFLRKYAAYSKRIIPVLSEEATQIIEDYYLDIRRLGEGENASVPITARQLEAFVRLSEASARSRLSRVVEVEDANRAVRLVRYYLEKIAGTSSGQLDIDMMATGIPKTQRERMPTIVQIIRQHGNKDGISLEELILHGEGEGISAKDVESMLNKMKTSGEIYCPKDGRFRVA